MKQMSVAPPGEAPLPSLTAIEVTPGRLTTGLGMDDGPDRSMDTTVPGFMRFVKIPDAHTWSTDPGFTRVKPGSNVFDTEAAIDGALALGAEVTTLLAPAGEEGDPIAWGEHDIWKKITVQKGRHPADHIKPKSPPLISPSTAWKETAAAVLAHYPDDFGIEPMPEPPVDTNAGAPLYLSGFGAKVAGACLLRPTAAETHAAGREACVMLNLPEAASLAYGFNTRTGPLAKAEPWFEFGPGGYTASRTATSRWCRTRHVFMGSMGVLLGTRGLARICKAGRRRLPGMWHAGDADDKLARRMHAMRIDRGWVMVEIDLSAFDRSLSLGLQLALADAFRRRWPWLSDAVDFYLLGEQLPTLSPSYYKQPGTRRVASIVTKLGEVSSGQLMTAEVGTLINLITALTAMREQGVSNPVDSWLRGEILILVQGDDMLLCAPAVDIDTFTATYAAAGLTAKVASGWRFLSKHMTPSGPLPIGGRIVQQTLFNEHEVLGPKLWPLNVLGLWARWGPGPPALVRPAVEELLQTSNLKKYLPRVSGPAAASFLASADGASAVEAALQERASARWVERVMADAPYSTSAAALAAALEQYGARPSTAYHDTGWTLIRRTMNAPVPVRTALLKELIAVAHEGSDALDAAALSFWKVSAAA